MEAADEMGGEERVASLGGDSCGVRSTTQNLPFLLYLLGLVCIQCLRFRTACCLLAATVDHAY
jgi:hypothetical protein